MKAIKEKCIVLLDPKVEETSTGGIIIPDKKDEWDKQAKGTVVALGTEYKDEPIDVGDRVIFGQNVGLKYSHNGKDYRIMNKNDINAVLEEGDE